jgi:hypothetical protein
MAYGFDRFLTKSALVPPIPPPTARLRRKHGPRRKRFPPTETGCRPRNRRFADSLLEEGGFELVVPL